MSRTQSVPASQREWTCDGCSSTQTGEPAHVESHPGADLHFCADCLSEGGRY